MKTKNLHTIMFIALGWLMAVVLPSTLHAAVVNSVGNGDWSSGSTWSTGTVPVGSDFVFISHQVALDQSINLSGYLKVDVGGTLEKSGNSQDIDILPGGMIDDYGRIICRNLSNSGILNVYNSGLAQYYFEASNNLDNNFGGIIHNWGWIEIPSLTNFVGGEIYNNTPVGTISITNKLDNSGLIDNDWIISITGNLINNQGTLQGDGGSYFCDPTFTNNAGAHVDCNGSPINICRPNGTYPVVNGSGDVNIACVLLCNGPWPNALAVNLISFEGKANSNGDVVLDWVSASEVNAARYEIERKIGNAEFSLVGTMEAARFSQNSRSYHMLDETAPAGVLQYRLKMVDYEEGFLYSSIVEVVSAGKENSLSVYPNPCSDRVTIAAKSLAGPLSILQLRQMQGDVVTSIPVDAVQGSIVAQADVSKLPNGVYLLEYFDGKEKKFSRVVVMH